LQRRLQRNHLFTSGYAWIEDMKQHRHVDLRIGALDRIRRRAKVRRVRGRRGLILTKQPSA
jgi:IS5 family transposase